jgi:hypothetical protein
MLTQIQLDDVVLDVVHKRVRYLRLSVHPPTGQVRISAPLRMSTKTIREFVVSKLDWIHRQQQRLRSRRQVTPCAYLDDERHFVWGEEHVLKVVEEDAAPFVELRDRTLLLHTRLGSVAGERQELVTDWYRTLLEAAAPPLIAKWEPLLRVTVARVAVRHMKTRWGSCTPRSRRIRLSTELAKKPPVCLEYVVVHEMVHLLEASHNRRFARLMDQFMPTWRLHRRELNHTSKTT